MILDLSATPRLRRTELLAGSLQCFARLLYARLLLGRVAATLGKAPPDVLDVTRVAGFVSHASSLLRVHAVRQRATSPDITEPPKP